jgi:hypothetical protein
MATITNRRRRARGCPLRRPIDPRCCGPAEVRVTDSHGVSLWGCTRHAAQALRLVARTQITATRRRGAAADVAAWLDGRTP